MEEKRMKTTAIADVTVRMEMDRYGAEWKVSDIIKQVERDAKNRIDSLCAGKATVVGVPKVKVVSMLEE